MMTKTPSRNEPNISRFHSSSMRRSHVSLVAYVVRQRPKVSRCGDHPAEATRGELESAELLQRCLHSRQDAWCEFAHRFHSVIASVVVKTLRRCVNPNPTLVDDLVQETYLKLCVNNFKALREFDCRHEHALPGFLKVVASNVTQDYLRGLLSRKRGSGKGEDDLEKAVPKAESVFNSAARIERELVVHQIQRCLDAQHSEPNFSRDRKIFWLYYRHGFTADAISQYPGIGLSVKGVESALFRLTELIRAKLNRRVRSEHSDTKIPVRRSA